MAVELVVKGFKTVEQARQWALWYDGQGEQDWYTWMLYRKEEGCDVMPANVSKIKQEGDTVTIEIKERD
jgi:hypothetical protein